MASTASEWNPTECYEASLTLGARVGPVAPYLAKVRRLPLGSALRYGERLWWRGTKHRRRLGGTRVR
jgi:hypothetical protein